MVTEQTKKNVLVLGGTGFLGKHVMRLLTEDENIFATSLSRSEETDIRNAEAFGARLRELKPDVIINCAAHVGSLHYVTTYAADVIRDNTLLLTNMYEGVKNVCPQALIINPLSNCSYPGAANTHYELEWEHGSVHASVLAYGSVKRLTYAFAESYKKQYGVLSVNWLVANAYGPGDYTDPNKVHALNGIIIRLIQTKRAGDATFEIWGTGTPLREWVYIEDVARMMVHSLSLKEQIYPVNLAQNKAYSIKEIAEMAAQALGYAPTFTFNTEKPDGAPIKILDDRIFRSSYPDFSFTPLSLGIKKTVAYYEEIL